MESTIIWLFFKSIKSLKTSFHNRRSSSCLKKVSKKSTARLAQQNFSFCILSHAGSIMAFLTTIVRRGLMRFSKLSRKKAF